MKPFNAPPTEAQAAYFRRLNAACVPKDRLDLTKVTCKDQRAELPLEFIYRDGSESFHYWLFDKCGKLQLTDDEKTFRKLADKGDDDEEHQRETPDPADKFPDPTAGPDKKAAIADIGRNELERANTAAKLRALLQSKGWPDEEIELGVRGFVGTDQRRHTVRRVEAEAWLRDQQLSTKQREFVLLYVFDGLRRKKLGKVFKRGKSWVYNERRKPAVKLCIKIITDAKEHGFNLFPTGKKQPAKAPFKKELPSTVESLCRYLRNWAKEANSMLSLPRPALGDRKDMRDVWEAMHRIAKVKSFLTEGKDKREVQEAMNESEPITADRIIRTIRSAPAILLVSDESGTLGGFVDLLEAAFYGESARRVPGVVGNGGREEVAMRARRCLEELLKPRRGGLYGFDEDLPGFILGEIRWGIEELQNVWRDFRFAGSGTFESALEQFRKLLDPEMQAWGDRKLHAFLTGESESVAAKYAEKATGLSAETFRRSYQKHHPPKR